MRKAFHNHPNQYMSTIIYEFIDNVDSLKSAVNNYLRKKKKKTSYLLGEACGCSLLYIE